MGMHEEEDSQYAQASNAADEQQQTMSRAKLNAANEKMLEDQLQISEDKVVDYVPGEN